MCGDARHLLFEMSAFRELEVLKQRLIQRYTLQAPQLSVLYSTTACVRPAAEMSHTTPRETRE